MKLLAYFLLLAPSLLLSSEVQVDVRQHSVEEAKGVQDEASRFVLEVTNKGKSPVTLGELNGDLIGCEIELWFLGKGVRLRNATDATWRREQAFINWKSIKLMPGESKQYSFDLKRLLPDDPENDDFANSLIENVERFKSGEVCVVLEYRDEMRGAVAMVAKGCRKIENPNP